jgi:hypothetical protein
MPLNLGSSAVCNLHFEKSSIVCLLPSNFYFWCNCIRLFARKSYVRLILLSLYFTICKKPEDVSYYIWGNFASNIAILKKKPLQLSYLLGNWVEFICNFYQFRFYVDICIEIYIYKKMFMFSIFSLRLHNKA